MIKVTALNVDLVGQVVPSKNEGAGQVIEQLLIEKGIPIDTRKAGADIVYPGYSPIEVKSRDVDSVSAADVCKMSPDYIKNTPYEDSILCEKMQQQFRVKTKNKIIVSNSMYDFSPPFIQEKLKEAYEICRTKLIAGNDSGYIYGTKWGYLEKNVKGSESYAFRISKGALIEYEGMGKSMFSTLYDEDE
jgi:hypothetical protein